MKKILFGLAAMAYAGVAFAGEYHSGAQLVCSDCHTMHDSRAHSFNSFSDQFVGGTLSGTASVGHHYLLVQSSVEGTCLACHDEKTFAPDVLGTAIAGGKSTNQKRSAGKLSKTGDADQFNGHTMGAKLLPPGYNNTNVWTGATDEGFSCADCHTPHGNDQFRNLVNKYNRLASPATTLVAPTPPSYVKAATQNINVDVTILDAAANSYDHDKVIFGNAVAGTPSKLNQFCAWCHGNFHGAGTLDGGGATIRHPTDVALKAANHSAIPIIVDSGTKGDQYQVIRPIRSALDTTAGRIDNAEVACISCHKAHGNGRGFGLIYPKWTDNATEGQAGTFSVSVNLEDGDDATIGVRSLCVSCHSMGQRFYAPN